MYIYTYIYIYTHTHTHTYTYIYTYTYKHTSLHTDTNMLHLLVAPVCPLPEHCILPTVPTVTALLAPLQSHNRELDSDLCPYRKEEASNL